MSESSINVRRTGIYFRKEYRLPTGLVGNVIEMHIRVYMCYYFVSLLGFLKITPR